MGTQKMNRGKVYLQRTNEHWRMTEEEVVPTGDEFEEFIDQLDSFLSGYFYALGYEDEPAYARGDFFWERTEAVYFTERSQLTQEFVRAVQRWLSAPRRNNWRVLIVGKETEDNFIVIYHDAIVLNPTIRSLEDAITERGESV